MRTLHKERKLTEADVVEYAKAGKYEETIAALATICSVPVEVVDRLMSGERYDPVLILARSADFGWETARAIIRARPGAKGTSTQAIEAALENFDRLTAATAQRVVRFWQVRQGTGERCCFRSNATNGRIYLRRKVKYAGTRPSRLALAS